MEFRKVENKELKLKQTKGELVSFFEDMVDSFIMLAQTNKSRLILIQKKRKLRFSLIGINLKKL